MKKLLALLLALVMVTALVPFSAMAEEVTTIKVLATNRMYMILLLCNIL